MLAVHQRLNNNAIYGDPSTSSSGDPTPDTLGGGDPDTAAYQRYLSSGRLVDGPAVLRALRRLRAAAGGEEPGWRRPTLVRGRPASLLERSVAALLTGDEPVAVRRVEGEQNEVQGTPGPEMGDRREEAELETGEGQENDENEEEKLEAGGQKETEQGPEKKPRVELELVRTVWHCVDVKPADTAADAASPTDVHIRNMFGEYGSTAILLDYSELMPFLMLTVGSMSFTCLYIILSLMYRQQ